MWVDHSILWMLESTIDHNHIVYMIYESMNDCDVFLPLFRLLKRLDFPSMKFSLYFMGYEKAEDIPTDDKERIRWTFSRKATVELTQ